MAGVAARSVVSVGLPQVTFLLLLGFTVAVVVRKTKPAAFLSFGIPVVLGCLCFAGGLLRMEAATWQFGQSALSNAREQEVTLQGVVIREPEVRTESTHLYVKVGADTLLVSTDRYTAVTYGDEVMVKGTLREPAAFTTELGRTFNYPGYLLARGVEYYVPFADVEVISSGQGNPLIQTLLSGKESLLAHIEMILKEPQAGLGEGLLLGVKQALGEDLERDFRKAGIIHIVVLSGYNIMLVVAFVMFALSLVAGRRLRVLLGLMAVTVFALVVGLSATVVRASIMAALFLVAQAFGRSYDVLRALLVAGFLMILLNPYLLVYDIGFQLSFMATLGLILIVPLFEQKVAAGKFAWREYFLATIATQVAVLPLLLYHVGEVSLVAIVVNLLVLPAVPLAMSLTFLSALLSFFSTSVGLAVGYLAHFVLSYIIVVASFFAALPFASVVVPAFPSWAALSLYALYLLIFWLWQRRSFAQNEFSGWQIVDESAVVLAQAQKGQASRRTVLPNDHHKKPTRPAQTDVPVFFR